MIRRSSFIRSYWLPLLATLLIVLHYTGLTKSLEAKFRSSLINVVRIGYEGRQSILSDEDTDGEESRIQSLESKVLELEAENQELREQLGFLERFEFTSIGAEVTSRSYDPSRAIMTIDRGGESGVEEGAPVVVGEGVIIGTVTEVFYDHSFVRLLLDPQSRVAGRLLNSEKTEGVVTGGYGIVVRMELIARDEEIPEGTLLVTSGLQNQIPRGLLIGKVIKVEPDTNTLFSRAIIETPVDYQTLTQVRIGIVPQDE